MSVEPLAEWTRVCAVEALREAGRKEVLVGRTALLLDWQAGSPVACKAHCPHAFAPLIDGVIADGRIHCARHQASFDLETGAVSGGWQLPPLQIYDVRLDADFVWVRAK